MAEDCCEVPFWLDRMDQSRRHRACVTCVRGQWVLRLPDGAEFALDPSADALDAVDRLARFLVLHAARLSPRALTLTAFIRLFLADQFVHGIGGGRYDRITDQLIGSWFKIAPPAFSVMTATLLFPTAASERRVDVHGLLIEGRRLRHGDGDVQKMQLVRAIAAAPRKSSQRQQLFMEMHRRLTSRLDHPDYRDWQARYARARELARSQQDVFDRELFYALQPHDRLQSLITRCQQHLT
jgi:hypothetical protein